MSKTVLVITGPTATGKTALGVELAIRLGGEVVSADSMQIYKGMDIGTAKVTAEEARGVPHHMTDVAAPDEDFSVARWVEGAALCVEDIFARGKTPVIVGGTGLYIDSLLSGRDFAANDPGGGLRQRLNEEYDCLGGKKMLEKLAEFDPERAAKLHFADKKRIVRAFEIFELTGKTITEHDEETKKLPPRWPSVRFALTFADRQALYDRIDLRVDKMLEAGLWDEVRALVKNNVPESSTAMQAIGYKQALLYLKGEISEGGAIELIKRESRRYAKRQLTWLGRDGELNWIKWDGVPDIPSAADRVASAFSQPQKI